MNVKKYGNDLVVTGLEDFNLKQIFECGQCFRWNSDDGSIYTGVAKGKALRIMQAHDSVTLFETSEEDFYNIWYDYFDLSRDYGAIKQKLSRDSVMRDAIRYGSGIRILRQDLWETIISFIISASNNIPRIKGIVERLCALYGNEIQYMGEIYYSFPDVKALLGAKKEELAPIRAGFRDKYIIDAVSKFGSGALSESSLRSLPAPEAKKALLSISGVGEKVANCIMLFGLSECSSFPVDVWIKRVMEYFYFDGEQSIEEVSKLARDKFGELGGFAQQYLFFYARETKIGI